MEGKIIKGIAGFYYVHAKDGNVYECRARGIFRKDNQKPLVGDNVEITVLDQEKAEGNLVKLAEADVAFHEVIYQSSDNRRLNQVLNNLREQIYRYRVEYLKDEQTRNLLVSEHEELVKAIREGDVQKAQDISFHHLENQRKAIIRTIRMRPKRPRKKNKNRICGNIKRDVIGASLFLTESSKSPVSIAKSNKQWGNLL